MTAEIRRLGGEVRTETRRSNGSWSRTAASCEVQAGDESFEPGEVISSLPLRNDRRA